MFSQSFRKQNHPELLSARLGKIISSEIFLGIISGEVFPGEYSRNISGNIPHPAGDTLILPQIQDKLNIAG